MSTGKPLLSKYVHENKMCSGDMATTVMDTDILADRFSRSTVPELKRYLQQRGVTVSLQEGAGCSGPSLPAAG